MTSLAWLVHFLGNLITTFTPGIEFFQKIFLVDTQCSSIILNTIYNFCENIRYQKLALKQQSSILIIKTKKLFISGYSNQRFFDFYFIPIQSSEFEFLDLEHITFARYDRFWQSLSQSAFSAMTDNRSRSHWSIMIFFSIALMSGHSKADSAECSLMDYWFYFSAKCALRSVT